MLHRPNKGRTVLIRDWANKLGKAMVLEPSLFFTKTVRIKVMNAEPALLSQLDLSNIYVCSNVGNGLNAAPCFARLPRKYKRAHPPMMTVTNPNQNIFCTVKKNSEE